MNIISTLASALGRMQRPTDATPVLVARGQVTLRDAKDLPELIAQIAESQIGVREGKLNNSGPKIEEYQRATWLAVGRWAWCAAFICWVIFQAIKTHGPVKWKRPQTAGAYDLENWARGGYDPECKKLWRVLDPQVTPPKRGDIVTFTWSHVGVVTGWDGNLCSTVEGNTGAVLTGTSDNQNGDGVFAKKHPRKKLRALIRYVG